jgi:predicted nucleic acid-binding protein
MIYFDASYLVRLYYKDRGFETVRHLANTDTIACAQHGQAEVIAALHRKYREGSLRLKAYRVVLEQFADEIRADAFRWLPLSQTLLEHLRVNFEGLPITNFLRASDAIHLTTASENAFREIYSNDKNLLTAAPHFGLRGVNVIE